MKALFLHLCLGFLLCTLSCSRDYPRESASNGGGNSLLRIVVILPGDDFPSPEDLSRLEAVGRMIEEGGIGEIKGSEAGMGSMSLTLRVEEPESAGDPVHRIVGENFQDLPFRIE